ncbi:MAG: hypothetical protein WC003_01425 [Terrimicrobiaceae bacterium]
MTTPTPDDPRLQKFRIFADLGGDELAALLKLTDAVTYPGGSRIVETGEAGHCLYGNQKYVDILLRSGAQG